MKTLLTFFVLFFSSLVFAQSTKKNDIYEYLAEGYEIIAVTKYNQDWIVYTLQLKDIDLVNCIYTFTGNYAACHLVKARN